MFRFTLLVSAKEHRNYATTVTTHHPMLIIIIRFSKGRQSSAWQHANRETTVGLHLNLALTRWV